MCCECEEKSGNFTYIAYATDLNGTNFSLSRNANAIKRCYQAIYVSAFELDTNLPIFQNYFYGRYYNICEAKQSNINYLPTPMIAKRKFLESGYDRNAVDSISPRNTTIEDLLAFDYPQKSYYIQMFDIYFNSFGKENAWLSLPDKRLELCLVSNKNYKNGKQRHTTTTELILSGQGNKDNFHNAIVHPANTSEANQNITGTIFSGGNANSPAVGLIGNSYILPTEWKIDENDYSFGDNVFNASGLNRFNNPNLTIQIDIRDLFRVYSKDNTEKLKYPHSFTQDGLVRVKNIGDIKYHSTNNKVYRRNSILYFRLSSGMPGTLNQSTNVYQKRIYSDLSIPIYICPKIGLFSDSSRLKTDFFMYGHKVLLGSK